MTAPSEMPAAEFSRVYRPRALPGAPVTLEANESERAALAERFGLIAIDRLTACIDLVAKDKGVAADGTVSADIMQGCAVSGEAFAVHIEEALTLRFVPASLHDVSPEQTDLEIELDRDALDEIAYEGDSFDLGEAVAQTLGLAIDPYAEGPGADEARAAAGITSDDAPSGPLAEALAKLTKG